MIGHIVHLEGCTIEDEALVGSGSIVLHGAVVRTRGDRRFERDGPEPQGDPAAAMALGVPVTIREDAVTPGHFDYGWQSYVERAKRYRATLRRID